jgi:hypothetical protein
MTVVMYNNDASGRLPKIAAVKFMQRTLCSVRVVTSWRAFLSEAIFNNHEIASAKSASQ